MKQNAAVAALLLCLFTVSGPPAARAAPESVEAIEKDLSAILAEMDAVRTELDRVAELSSLPKVTGVRIEIRGAGGVASPASVRVLVGGKTEDEREFAKAERDAFAGNAAPLVVQVPLLPGSHKARVELSHPFWKSPVAADFTAGVAAGTTAVVRFRLAAPAGNGAPALAPMAGP